LTRPRPNRLGMYSDVREILDAALRANGGNYKLATHGQAVHWRQRAYKFRKLYAEVHGDHRESPYDALTLPTVPSDSSTVMIRVITKQGTFEPNEEPATFPNDLELFTDDLQEVADEIAKKLEGKL
jgi:hypothetical protein